MDDEEFAAWIGVGVLTLLVGGLLLLVFRAMG